MPLNRDQLNELAFLEHVHSEPGESLDCPSCGAKVPKPGLCETCYMVMAHLQSMRDRKEGES